MRRSAGILMPVFSLPSEYGIGTFGKEAYKFVDFLADSGQTYWQMLPLGPTGFGNSPYQSLSSFAGNPYFIDLEMLCEEGLLDDKELKKLDWGKDRTKVDYGALYNNRFTVLRKACKALEKKHPQAYLEFLAENLDWVKDYAIFMAIKNDRKGEPWVKWPSALRNHHSNEVKEEAERLKEEVIFYERMQYLFFSQLEKLKSYANEKGIQIIGDLPFYAAQDSIDVWSNPEQFDMNDDFEMAYVAGFGPDDGNPNGQKWGNPLFDWDRQRNDGYNWWIERAHHICKSCDVLRIDHFHGYESFFAVPDKGEPKDGHWRNGPGLDIFRAFEHRYPGVDMILEDLGQLTPEFLRMVEESGYPGMRILQYAFDPNDPMSLYMPFQYPLNTVAYTGTHDNNTLLGWLNDVDQKERVKRAMEYFDIDDVKKAEWRLLKGVYGSTSNLAIVQMQDLLSLGEESRTNNPSAYETAWTWRMEKDALDDKLAKKLHDCMKLYGRYNWDIKE